MKKYPFVKQHDEKDCGAAAAAMLCKYWGSHVSLVDMRSMVRTDINGTTMLGLVEGLTMAGFTASGASGDRSELLSAIADGEIQLPFIARIIKENYLEHFVVVYKLTDKTAVIGDPAIGIIKLKLDTFFELWTGHIIFAEPGDSFIPVKASGNKFSKYLSIVFKQKKLIVLSLILSLIISAITIAGSFVFYAVIEEVTGDTEDADHTHQEEVLDEEADEDNHDDNFVEKATDDIADWLDEQPFTLVLDKLLFNTNIVFVIILALYLLRTVLNVFRGKALAMLAKRVECGILFRSYSKILNIPLEFFESRTTGEIMSRFDDISEICDAVSNGALTLILDTLMVIITGVILLFLSPELFALSIIIILLYIFIILVFMKPITRLSQSVMEKNATITSLFKQTVDGILAIKSYSNIGRKSETVCREYDSYTDLKYKASVVETLQASVAAFVAVGGLVLILWQGTIMCLQGILSLGILLTYYNILNYFLTSVTNLVGLQTDIQTAVVSADRLNDILDYRNKSICESVEKEFAVGDIEFSKVSFRYGGGPKLFDDLSFRLPFGEKVAIIGESGCGKSTIAKLISSFYDIESGEITVNKTPLESYVTDTLRKHIMYVSGDGLLFDDTIRNNIAMDNDDISDDEIIEVCKKLQIDDFIQSLPFGYESCVDENGSIFSTGQRQRINIARALIQKPEILILDEATSNLDLISEVRINELLNQLRGKTLCIIIAHKLNSIKDCDRIILMEHGKIVQIGTHEELMKNSRLYLQYCQC